MDFHKLILYFWKSWNEIGQKHFGPHPKKNVFSTQGLPWELQELLFKISPKTSDGRIFWKTKKTLIFVFYDEMWIFL